jgi:hypothetical protein
MVHWIWIGRLYRTEWLCARSAVSKYSTMTHHHHYHHHNVFFSHAVHTKHSGSTVLLDPRHIIHNQGGCLHTYLATLLRVHCSLIQSLELGAFWIWKNGSWGRNACPFIVVYTVFWNIAGEGGSCQLRAAHRGTESLLAGINICILSFFGFMTKFRRDVVANDICLLL